MQRKAAAARLWGTCALRADMKKAASLSGRPVSFIRSALAGVVGFEPTNVGFRIRCLNRTWRYPSAWCGRRDSNSHGCSPADFESATSTIPSHRHVTWILYRIFIPNARQKLRPRRGRNLVFQNGLTASPTGRAALHGGRPDYQRAHSCRRSTAWCRRTGCIRRSCRR